MQLFPTIIKNNKPNLQVVSLACGAHNAGAVTASGNLFTWGRNTNACLGQRHRRHSQSFPLQVGALSLNINHLNIFFLVIFEYILENRLCSLYLFNIYVFVME